MNAGIEFLPMSEGDLDWVVDNEGQLHPFPWTRGNFVDALSAGYSSWVCRVDGERTGYAIMLLVLDEAHLLNLSIARCRQGTGLGSAFLGFLFDEASRHGVSQFFLEVRPSNLPALALYRRTGFCAVGRRKRYYPAGEGEREDAIVMRRDL